MTVLMRGENIGFNGKIRKIILKLSLLTIYIWRTAIPFGLCCPSTFHFLNDIKMTSLNFTDYLHTFSELQIRGGVEDNLKTIFLIM